MILDNKQYDPRWALRPYAGGTYQDSACGPVSISDILEDADPGVDCDWLTAHGYASDGSGTYWEGISPCVQARGIGSSQLVYSSLYGVYEHRLFDEFKAHIQQGYCGILLMGRGMWSNSGHFICICGYQNGLYLVHDPASQQRSSSLGTSRPSR